MSIEKKMVAIAEHILTFDLWGKHRIDLFSNWTFWHQTEP